MMATRSFETVGHIAHMNLTLLPSPTHTLDINTRTHARAHAQQATVQARTNTHKRTHTRAHPQGGSMMATRSFETAGHIAHMNLTHTPRPPPPPPLLAHTLDNARTRSTQHTTMHGRTSTHKHTHTHATTGRVDDGNSVV